MLRMQAQNVLATQKNQIACSKSNSLLFLSIFSKIPSIKVLKSKKRLSFVDNDNKASTTKKMKWQTMDEMHGSKKTDASTKRKNNIFRKA